MGQIYRFLGLTVGCIVHGLDDDERRAAYAADITYGTNNEFGFDYLRDNMKYRLEEMVQRPFNFAIVDEVDSILVDEARTPLIISGPSTDSSELYLAVDRLIPRLEASDFDKDEKQRAISFTEAGTEKMEIALKEIGLLKTGALYDIHNIALVHHANQALRAHKLFQKDKDYIVKDDKVVIIDEFTGRMMEGRRYSDGLHQALEAKEHVTIQRENQTLASITFQNYFRMYPKLSGMTGTAMTEAAEFAEIYGLEVVEIPTNIPVTRIDHDDEVYRRAYEKNNVLNARFHEQEAYIVAQAGRPGAVTIATNMAGRGTDIQLGGNLDMRIALELKDITDEAERARRIEKIREEIAAAKELVLKAGGLYVVGTERHEARRIDNQLRGRSGRQGDPGASKFFLSLEDDLMRIFGSQRMDGMLEKLGLQEGEAIIHSWINKALEKAQQKVENHNFEIRKNLLKFDNVMNDQRKVIYEQRREIMDSPEVSQTIADMRHEMIEALVRRHIPANSYPEQWDLKALQDEIRHAFNLPLPVEDWAKEEGIDEEALIERINGAADRKMAEKAANYGPETMRSVEKSLLLQLLDQAWKEHLLHLDHLRQGINLRAYGQRDPLNEYKREAFEMFEQMLVHLRGSITTLLMHVEIQLAPTEDVEAVIGRRPQEMRETRHDPALAAGEPEPVAEAAPPQRRMPVTVTLPAPAAQVRSTSSATGGFSALRDTLTQIP